MNHFVPYFTYAESPLRRLLLVSDGDVLTGLYMEGQQYEKTPGPEWIQDDEREIFVQTKQELAEYFDGKRNAFSVPIAFHGSPFQNRVWQLLADIPFGTTTTYGALAQELGDAGAARTVGHTIGQNPISVIVPCHRVVASTGALTGYNGGIQRKRYLLDLEAGKLQLL